MIPAPLYAGDALSIGPIRGTRSLGEPQLDTLTQASSILASRTELLDGPVDRRSLIRSVAAFNSQ